MNPNPPDRRRVRPCALVLPLALGLVAAAPLGLTATATAAPQESSEREPNEHAHAHEHPDHEPTEEIVVTGSPLEHERDELAIPIDRIDRENLLDHLGSTLGDTLSHIPGITSTGFSSGASRPVVRGQDAYRTALLEDGLGTQDVSQESPDHATPVNPLAARRVEVIRGPAVLRYGGGASAGVVNVITNRVPDRLPGDSIGGDVYGGVGLVANDRDLAAMLDGGLGSFAWHADGLFQRRNNYAIPNDGTPHVQPGSQVESWMGSVGGAYLGERGRIGGAYTRVENVYGIPETDEPVEIDMHTDRFRVEGDLFDPLPGIREVRLRSVYSNYQHEEIADGAVGQTYRNKEFEGRLEAIHDELLGFNGAFGLHAKHRDFRGEGEAAEFLAPTDTTSAAFYLFEERPLGDVLSVETGFRFEHVRVDGIDQAGINRDLDFAPISGALGLLATPNEWLTIKLNGAVSQRTPSQVELLARGPHEATNTYEIGDPGLDEETSYTGDLRIEVETERGHFEVATFVSQYDDYIFAGLTGVFVDETNNVVAATDPDALRQLRYGNRDALFWGAELQGRLDVVKIGPGMLGVDARFDYVRAQFDSNTASGGRDLPRIVPIRWGAGLTYDTETTSARVGFVRTEAQEKVGDFESSTNGFTYLDASLNQRIGLIDGVPIELSVIARNLTDVRGRNHISFNKDDVILSGRSIRFGLRATF